MKIENMKYNVKIYSNEGKTSLIMNKKQLNKLKKYIKGYMYDNTLIMKNGDYIEITDENFNKIRL